MLAPKFPVHDYRRQVGPHSTREVGSLFLQPWCKCAASVFRAGAPLAGRPWPPPVMPSIGRARSGDLPRVAENARSTGLEGHLLAKIKELSKQLDQERGVPDTGQVWEEPSQRVIVVANRLPVTPRRSKDTGEWIFERSSGGLVSALLGVPSIEITWVGWIGIDVPLEERDELTRLMHEQKPFKCVPG